MKKAILAILAASLILSACTVGPMEEPHETLPTPDTSVPDNVVTDDTGPSEEAPVEPDTQPGDIAVSHDVGSPDDEIIPPAEPDDDVTEPAEEPAEEPVTPIEDLIIAIDDAEYGVMYSTISLNVRTGPSTDYKSIGALSEGEAVNVLGYASEYGWYLIEFKGGTGYVSGSYLTAVNPNLMPEPDDDYFPGIDIDEDRVYEIINAFADYSGYWAIDIAMTGYYGDYSAGAVVKMSMESVGGDEHSNTQKIGGYDFTLYTPTIDLYVYTASGKFVLLRDAYENGSITDSDIRAINYYFEDGANMYYVGIDEPSGFPKLEQPSVAYKMAICEDYEKANDLVEGTAYIASYYGTYSGGDAVVMWTYDPYFLPDEKIGIPMTADMKEIVISKRRFVLGSGSLDITFHTKDGKFIDLQKAYKDGIISAEDLDAICYYNRHRN